MGKPRKKSIATIARRVGETPAGLLAVPAKPADFHVRLPPDLAALARAAAEKAGRPISNYVRWLILEDLRRGKVE